MKYHVVEYDAPIKNDVQVEGGKQYIIKEKKVSSQNRIV